MCCLKPLRMQKFFCCWSLRIGSLIIGYLGLISSVLQSAGGAAQLAYLTVPSVPENSTEVQTIDVQQYSEYIAIGIAYHVISFFFNLALVYGIHKFKRECLLPWLIFKGFEWVAVVILSIIATIVYGNNSQIETYSIVILIGLLVFCVWLATYMFLCVYSYYHELKQQQPQIQHFEEQPPAYINAFNIDKSEKAMEAGINQ